jgi:hypothetical protein
MRSKAAAANSSQFPFHVEPATSALEIVPPSPIPHDRPAEQLLLIRTLELVQSIHASQRAITEGLRDIKANLPLQRRPLSLRTQAIHVMVTATRRNGLCPCCQETPVCTEAGRLAGAEYDHYFARNQNRVTQTWLVCEQCNQDLINTDFKVEVRSSFESYQAAVRPMLNRQMAFPVMEKPAAGERAE